MFRPGVLVVFALPLVLLAGCGLDVRADAAQGIARFDVRADAAQGIARFLDAVRRDDHRAFEASIDRPALRSDLRDQLADLGRARGLDIEGGASEFALDRMITPDAFRVLGQRTGQPLPVAPTAAQVALLMKVKDRGHVCLTDTGRDRCLLSFARTSGVWRLTGMQAAELKVVTLPPAKPRA
jgi:hypothetical protein